MRTLPPKVVVIGSLNVDYIASVKTLPDAGQTVAAVDLIRRFGGKGANQAVAAARQGAKVFMAGCVGADDEGRAYRARLIQEGIDTSALRQVHNVLTGTALIAVDRAGENMIIVAPGANGEVAAPKLPFARLLNQKPAAVLLQFEIPMPAVLAVIRFANDEGVPVVLNPSPLREGFSWGRILLDTLIVNEGEAEIIFRQAPAAMSRNLSTWRAALAEYQINHLIVTRGAQSTFCLSVAEFLQVPTIKVKPVDTVGAGDAFAGTFVACRARGLELAKAIRLANCAGALTTLKPGAQEAIPNRSATERAARRRT